MSVGGVRKPQAPSMSIAAMTAAERQVEDGDMAGIVLTDACQRQGDVLQPLGRWRHTAPQEVSGTSLGIGRHLGAPRSGTTVGGPLDPAIPATPGALCKSLGQEVGQEVSGTYRADNRAARAGA